MSLPKGATLGSEYGCNIPTMVLGDAIHDAVQQIAGWQAKAIDEYVWSKCIELDVTPEVFADEYAVLVETTSSGEGSEVKVSMTLTTIKASEYGASGLVFLSGPRFEVEV